MSINTIDNYFKVNSLTFKQNYTKAIKIADASSMHDLRVSVKRISALVRLINFGKSDNYRIKNNFPHLKLVFKTAAAVRDYQVLEILLMHYQQFKDLNIEILLEQVNKFKQHAINEFFTGAKKFNIMAITRLFNLIASHINNLDGIFLSQQVPSFKSNRLILLANYSRPESDLYNLHSARKIIKELGYLIEMSESNPSENIGELQVYKEAGRYLGEWHDRLVLLDFLIQKEKTPPFKNTGLRNIIGLLSEEKESLKNQYFDLFRSIVGS